jgi:PAS domain S-box-containing protein
MARDSADQAAILDSLATTKKEYETIFDAVSEAIFLVDVDEDETIRFQRFNQREEEFTGKSTEEVRGKTPVEVFGEELGKRLRNNYRRCIEQKEPVTYEETIQMDAEPTVWQTTLTPIVENGQVQRIVGSGREITELRNSKQELERRLSFLENISEVIAVLDETGIVQYQNHCREHLPGPDVFDLTGAEPSEYIHPDDREEAMETFRSVLESPGKTAHNELRIEQINGEFGWYEQRVVNLVDDPAVQGVLVSSRDISDRKAKQAKLEGIFEAARDVSFVIAKPTADGADARIQEFSPGAERLFGYDRKEAIGESIGLLHQQHEIEQIPEIKDLIESGESWYDEIKHVRKDGSTFAALLSIHPVKLEGQTCFLGVSIDISERKERERALKELHGSTRDLMTATTAEEVVTIGSNAAAEVLNHVINGIHLYEPDEDALVPVAWTDNSEKLLDEAPPILGIKDSLAGQVYRTGVSEYYPDITNEPGRFATDTPFGSELVLPLDEHGVFILSSTATEAFSQIDKTLAQVLATNIKTALDRVEQRQEIERQNERLNKFASVLSHDLRNPLSVASGRLELAQSESDSTHLDAVSQAHARMETLIDDLLTLAREGNSVGELESVRLDSLVEGCWRNVDTEEATIRIEAERTIRADRSRLQQLLENLFRNAVEHSGKNVSITVGVFDTGFYIEDDGQGIPPERRDKVFDIGYSTADEGTGFGLAIVRRIAEAHGWNISAIEASTGGARFEITGVDIVSQ